MKALIRLSAVAMVCGLGLTAASDAEARGGFLRGLFNRGGSCCSPCEPVCCEVQTSCHSPCGCETAAYSDCGCAGAVGGAAPTGVVTQEGGPPPIPAEAEGSPADSMPPVPEPPQADQQNAEQPESDQQPPAPPTEEEQQEGGSAA